MSPSVATSGLLALTADPVSHGDAVNIPRVAQVLSLFRQGRR